MILMLMMVGDGIHRGDDYFCWVPQAWLWIFFGPQIGRKMSPGCGKDAVSPIMFSFMILFWVNISDIYQFRLVDIL